MLVLYLSSSKYLYLVKINRSTLMIFLSQIVRRGTWLVQIRKYWKFRWIFWSRYFQLTGSCCLHIKCIIERYRTAEHRLGIIGYFQSSLDKVLRLKIFWLINHPASVWFKGLFSDSQGWNTLPEWTTLLMLWKPPLDHDWAALVRGLLEWHEVDIDRKIFVLRTYLEISSSEYS